MGVIWVTVSNLEEKKYQQPQNSSKSSHIIWMNQQEQLTTKHFIKQHWSIAPKSSLQEPPLIADSLTTRNSDRFVTKSVPTFTVISPTPQAWCPQERSLQLSTTLILLWLPLIKQCEEQGVLWYSTGLVLKKIKKATKSLMTLKAKSMELCSPDYKVDPTCTLSLVSQLLWERPAHQNSNFTNNK